MIIIKKILALCMAIALCLGVYVGIQPEEYSFFTDEQIKTDNLLIKLDLDSAETATGLTQTNALPQGKYTARIKLFGFLPIRNVRVNLVERTDIIPLGVAFGVKLYTEGVIVVDITDFVHNGRVQNPAYSAGIREGDVILKYNGVAVRSNEELIAQVKKFDGTPQHAVIRRNNLTFEADVTPLADDTDGKYRIGLWVRDSTAGIGMLTYYDPSKNLLTGLGHSISDSDTGQIMPVETGELVRADIEGVVKGEAGKPGELLGSFDENAIIGVLTENTATGLFATAVTDEFRSYPSYPVALKEDIVVGKAEIITSVSGRERQTYEVEIVRINNNLQETKNMVIRITDKRLLERTGGIVQGMSGSPIIQNGKIIGAVTHVLVNDPQKGYGIFIENMLASSQSAEKEG